MLEHGGALRAAAVRYGIPLRHWLDLSTGVNPLGWPVPPIPAMAWQRLPEAGDGLEQAAEAYYGTSHVLPVAGSQAAIQALPLLRERSRVGVLHPSYAEHAHAWRRVGHDVQALTFDQLESAVDQLDVLILIHPNNPTGSHFSPAILLNWRARLAARKGWLLVDEAFMDATPAESLVDYIGLPGLIVLRSLGKFFGLAGARVGFTLAESAILQGLKDLLGPWTVSGPARWVATQVLNDRDWQNKTRIDLNDSEKRLAYLLKQQGLLASGGTALFQWIPFPNSALFQHTLAQHGILVRCFSDPHGLRIGLPGTESDWQRLELTLAKVWL